eukprot:862967-Pyramimonas_sp.AAC.1
MTTATTAAATAAAAARTPGPRAAPPEALRSSRPADGTPSGPCNDRYRCSFCWRAFVATAGF